MPNHSSLTGATLRRLAAASAAATLALLTISSIGASASADELLPISTPSLDEQVADILAEHPGGTRINQNEISWNDGDIILTLEIPGAFAPMSVGSCADGTFCAYSGTNLTGSKVAYASCNTTHGIVGISTVRSLANAWGSGYIQARNSGGSTLATVYNAGQLSTAPSGITQIRCVS